MVIGLVALALCQPDKAVADHVPDSLSQDVDPNYIACMMAVDDASPDILSALQTTCFTAMIKICSVSENHTPSPQAIDCISFETRRGLDFLEAAVANLPEEVDKKGFIGRRYQGQRDRIIQDLEAAKAFAAPESFEGAVEQSIKMATSVIELVFLAKRVEIQLEALVSVPFGNH